MKKIIVLILCMALVFSFAGCSKEDATTTSNTESHEDSLVNEVESSDETETDGIITFGTYEQDNNTSNGTEPIEWIVIDEQDGKILVVSKLVLDASMYHDTDGVVTWETSAIRAWLNGSFYNTAFTTSEQEKIATTTVSTPDYSFTSSSGNEYVIPGCADTNDKVFLLSRDEANEYFTSDDERVAVSSDYAMAKAIEKGYAFPSAGVSDEVRDKYSWWLRSQGTSLDSAAWVNANGIIYNMLGKAYQKGNYEINSFFGIRPAMWITKTGY